VQVFDWQTITEKHGPLVWQTAYRLLRHEADAADCFQETFVAAFEFSQKQRVRNMAGLLTRLATIRAIDKLRRRARNSPARWEDAAPHAAVSREPGPDTSALSKELAARLRAAISRLPETEAKVFCLRHFSDMSYREIARELQIKTSAAGVLLHRAKARLREILLATEPEEMRSSHGTSR